MNSGQHLLKPNIGTAKGFESKASYTMTHLFGRKWFEISGLIFLSTYIGRPIFNRALFLHTGVPAFQGWFNSSQWRIYVSANEVGIISDNGLSPIRRQAIIFTNYGLLSIAPLGK